MPADWTQIREGLRFEPPPPKDAHDQSSRRHSAHRHPQCTQMPGQAAYELPTASGSFNIRLKNLRNIRTLPSPADRIQCSHDHDGQEAAYKLGDDEGWR